MQKLQHLTGENVKQIASGRNHFLLVTESGKLFSFGMGKHGVLGHGDSINTAHPKLVEALNGSSVTCAACCGHQSAIITSDSKLLLWGWMGHDAFAAVLRPTVPEGLRTTLVEHVALGDDFCVIGTDGGKVLAWGGNAEGQVGCASEEDYIATPTAVVGVSGFGNRCHSSGLLPLNHLLLVLVRSARACGVCQVGRGSDIPGGSVLLGPQLEQREQASSQGAAARFSKAHQASRGGVRSRAGSRV